MVYQYTIQDLANACDVSTTTIYNQFKGNKDFIKTNSRREKNPNNKKSMIIKYNQSVLDWLLSIYGENASNSADVLLENETARGTSQPSFLETGPREGPGEHAATPSPTLQEPSQGQSIGESTKNPLETKIEALEAKITTLEAQIADLINQNGNLLLLLSQEKQEKQLLLPAPKKPLGERIKGIFGKNAKQDGEVFLHSIFANGEVFLHFIAFLGAVFLHFIFLGTVEK